MLTNKIQNIKKKMALIFELDSVIPILLIWWICVCLDTKKITNAYGIRIMDPVDHFNNEMEENVGTRPVCYSILEPNDISIVKLIAIAFRFDSNLKKEAFVIVPLQSIQGKKEEEFVILEGDRLDMDKLASIYAMSYSRNFE